MNRVVNAHAIAPSARKRIVAHEDVLVVPVQEGKAEQRNEREERQQRDECGGGVRAGSPTARHP